jgi:GTP cyclohydrolase I
MKHITYEKYKEDCYQLSEKVGNGYSGVYGIPRGGVLVAHILSEELDIPFQEKPDKHSLIVDDLIDSGESLSKYSDNRKAVLYRKPYSPLICDSIETIDDWIEFFYENTNDDMEGSVARILEYIGENPNRDGLKDTPKRIVQSWEDLYKGYKQNPKSLVKVFNCESYTGMVLLKDIELYSMCEHHMLPFVGRCHIAYIPNKKVIGISKLARIMEVYARRLQIQERLTDEIASCIEKLLKPKGVAVMIEAEHFCMRMRGVGKQNSIMVTSSLTGVFLKEEATRNEFLTLIKGGI